MNEFIKDQKALKTSRIFYFLFGGNYKEKYYPVNKGVNSLIEEKKESLELELSFNARTYVWQTWTWVQALAQKRKKKKKKGRKRKFLRLNHIKLSLMLHVVHRTTPKTNESWRQEIKKCINTHQTSANTRAEIALSVLTGKLNPCSETTMEIFKPLNVQAGVFMSSITPVFPVRTRYHVVSSSTKHKNSRERLAEGDFSQHFRMWNSPLELQKGSRVI